mmetsp:Transcript_31015/g.88494  ORF Transcript_31015/g.88494 Transcript_31015/m.88494 type:complete len:340 (-) Transcript_31015:458-1477(-)
MRSKTCFSRDAIFEFSFFELDCGTSAMVCTVVTMRSVVGDCTGLLTAPPWDFSMTATRLRSSLSSVRTSCATASKLVAMSSRWLNASSNSASSSCPAGGSSHPRPNRFGLVCGVHAALPEGLKQTKAVLSFVRERCTMFARWPMLVLVSRTSFCSLRCCNSRRSARFEMRSALLRSASALSRSSCALMPPANCARNCDIRASLSSNFCLNSSRSSLMLAADAMDRECAKLSSQALAALSMTPGLAAVMVALLLKPLTSSRHVSSNSDISELVLSCALNSLRILDTEWSLRNCLMTVAAISESSNMRSCNCERRSRFSSISFLFVSRMHERRNSLVSGSR